MTPVRRADLVERIDAPFGLVVVEAVPGAGKRTLLTQWARQGQGRVFATGVQAVRTPAELLAHTVWAIQRAAERDGLPFPSALREPAAPADVTELVDVLTGMLHLLPWLRVVAFDELTEIRPGLVVEIFDRVRREHPSLRLVLATVDGTEHMAAARRRGIPVSLLRDEDVRLTAEETREYVRTAIPGTSDEAAARLWQASAGFGQLVVAAVREMPERVAAGDVEPADLVPMWRSWRIARRRPAAGSSFERAVARLCGLPRFTVRQAREIVGTPQVDQVLERMERSSFITREARWDCGSDLFTWHGGLRRLLDEQARDTLTGRQVEARLERMLEVARTTHDWPLALLALLELRRGEEAETLAVQRLWELLACDDLDLAPALRLLRRDQLASSPTLRLLELVMGRRGVPLSSRDDALVPPVLLRWRREISSLEPRARLARLAPLAHQASSSGALDLADELLTRWLEIADDIGEHLLAHPDAEVVSAALIALQVLIQLDRYTEAHAAHRLARAILAADGHGDCDPSGGRQAELAKARALLAWLDGSPYRPSGSDPIDLVLPTSRRSFDIVVRATSRVLEALDAGDLDQARRLSAGALSQVSDPVRWPVLLLVHVLVLVMRGERTELEHLEGRYLGEEWRRRHESPGRRVRPIATLVRVLLDYVAGREISPDLEAAVRSARLLSDDTESPFGQFLVSLVATLRGESISVARLDWVGRGNVRVRDAALLLEALRAVKSGEDGLARVALRTLGLEPSGVAPLALAAGTPAEREEVIRLATEVMPPSEVARLELSRAYVGVSPDRWPSLELSEREHELLALIRDDRSNADIARELFVSVNTVKFHRTNLYRKLGARNRSDVLAAALRFGL
ncbi:MAG: hypothetical protein J0H73_03250 [Salana multivorans]|nr:hypothetical protein [Salana multivorans]